MVATTFGMKLVGPSHTSSNGHAIGFRWQNNKNSKAITPAGTTTRLHCKNPGQHPLVGPRKVPQRTNSRNSRGVTGTDGAPARTASSKEISVEKWPSLECSKNICS